MNCETKERKQKEEDKKERRKHDSHILFALLFQDEPDYVKPAPFLNYDISYVSPVVTTQIVA